jgi:hypothetical protein
MGQSIHRAYPAISDNDDEAHKHPREMLQTCVMTGSFGAGGQASRNRWRCIGAAM